jgi:iron complex outermembrane recepter protein
MNTRGSILLASLVTTVASAQVGNSALEEVVVTAQKRSQNQQEVSIAISAISGAELRELGTASSEDIQNSIAGMQQYNYTGSGQPQFFVRGIGTADFAQNTPPTTPVYQDEIYTGSSVISSFMLFDLDGVEVLKGPQGTLFGRNTVGGAISYRSRRPSEQSEGYLALDLGEFESAGVEGAVGGPINERIQFRLAAKYVNQNEGFFDNTAAASDSPAFVIPIGDQFFRPSREAGDREAAAVRGMLQFEPTDDLTILVSASYGESRGSTYPLSSMGFTSLNAADPCALDPAAGGSLRSGVFDPARCGAFGYSESDSIRDYHNDYIGDQDMGGSVLSLRADWDADLFTLTSLASYTDGEQALGTDVDGSPVRISAKIRDYSVEAFSQELRVAAASDRLFWLAGGYFSTDEIGLFDDAQFSPTIGLTNFADPAYNTSAIDGAFVSNLQKTDTLAAFAHVEVELTDAFKLTVSSRWTQVDKGMQGGTFWIFDQPFAAGQVPARIVAADVDGTGPGVVDEDRTFEEVTGRVALDWMPADDVLLYGTYSRGFREGGFEGNFVLSARNATSYDSETLDAFELGWKTEFANSTVRVNGAVYYYKYADAQQRTTSVQLGVPANFITNVGDASQVGAEADLLWQPTDSLTLKAGAAWLDQEVKPDADIVDIQRGDVFPYAADLSYTLMSRYNVQLGGGLVLGLQGDLKYTGDYHTTAENLEFLKQESYTLVNARASLENIDSQWELALWGKNLTEEEYITQVYALFGAYVVGYNAPRTFGLSFMKRW